MLRHIKITFNANAALCRRRIVNFAIISKLRFQLMCFADHNDRDLYLHDTVTDRDGDSSLNIETRKT